MGHMMNISHHQLIGNRQYFARSILIGLLKIRSHWRKCNFHREQNLRFWRFDNPLVYSKIQELHHLLPLQWRSPHMKWPLFDTVYPNKWSLARFL